jgi:hypothetical protein
LEPSDNPAWYLDMNLGITMQLHHEYLNKLFHLSYPYTPNQKTIIQANDMDESILYEGYIFHTVSPARF